MLNKKKRENQGDIGNLNNLPLIQVENCLETQWSDSNNLLVIFQSLLTLGFYWLPQKKIFFFFFKGARAYGNSWAMGCIQPIPQPQQCWIRAASATYAAAWGNARSLTYWARLGMKNLRPRRHCVGFFILWATTGAPIGCLGVGYDLPQLCHFPYDPIM